MTVTEFVEWVQRLANEERLTPAQANDIIHQRQMFDENRDALQAEFRGRVVGYCARERLVGETVTSVLDRAREIYQGRQLVYLEVISSSHVVELR